MTYIIGGTWFLVGLATAFFFASVWLAAGITLLAIVVGWSYLAAHLTGIRKGEKRVNDL